MKSFKDLRHIIFCGARVFCAICLLFAIAISVVSLHYSEAIENDGLTLYKALDSYTNSCENSQQDDNDNDNETIKVLGELDTLKQFQLSFPLPLRLDMSVLNT